ncbi:hypothetical protein CDAR_22141 [Caerostris darwini]|uniref:Uncharacterized protein n=1 Tax=Caerostris darwini TaxID=1538125 RepID=A0AAV4URY3_9ARAC|nr:hypothetical protein CDAR_22141 [Caerostris darwini]
MWSCSILHKNCRAQARSLLQFRNDKILQHLPMFLTSNGAAIYIDTPLTDYRNNPLPPIKFGEGVKSVKGACRAIDTGYNLRIGYLSTEQSVVVINANATERDKTDISHYPLVSGTCVGKIQSEHAWMHSVCGMLREVSMFSFSHEVLGSGFGNCFVPGVAVKGQKISDFNEIYSRAECIIK